MGANPIRALLFLAGGVVAALVTAYFAGAFGPDAGQAPKVAAVPPDAATSQGSSAKGDRPKISAPDETPAAAPEPVAPAVPASPDSADALANDGPAEAAKPDLIVPSFDLVRVEGNGSLVVAGKAAPSARVEVLTGSTVVGATQAEPGGDFVSVLDRPLEPGEHQVVLRSTTPDNVVAMSTETALISVPDQPDGQVLALVEEPGKPSELITVPEPKAPAAPAGGNETAEAAEPAGAGQAPAVAAAPAVDASPDAGETEVAAAEPQAPAAPAAPAMPADGATQMAARGPADGQPAADAAASAHEHGQPQAQVKVEAVEIEGRKVFVAGSAEPGSVVRVYANDALLGETRAGPNGRFLVETERDIAVGDYIIRADLVADDGSEVISRAAVPFERAPGEAIAAVAPPVEPAAPAAIDQAAPAATDQAAPATPGASESPAASEQVAASAASQPSGNGQAPAADAQPASEASQPSDTPASGAAEASTAPAAPAAEPGAQPSADGSSQVAAAGQGTVLPELGTGIAGEAPEVTAAKLEPATGAVIIRRGDSLWRISRRVYGRGVRYSTIYLANQDQIQDPNLILPGQVFTVPRTTEEGETADMKAIGDQATTR